MSHPHLLAILLLSLALAGCGSKDAAPAPAVDTGHVLTGIVVDSAVRPVGDAEVTIQGNQTRTDEAGRFRFTHIEAEQVELRVEAPGLLPFARIVTFTGQTEEMRITLNPQPLDSSYIRVTDFQGFIECSGFVAVGHSHGGGGPPEGENPTDCGTYATTQNAWDAEVAPGLDGLVIELVWEPQTNLAQFLLAISYQVLDDGTLDYLAFGEGASPLKLVFPAFDVQDRFEDGGTIRTIVEIGGDPNGEDVAAGLAIDQQFQGFVSQFYGFRPPASYSFVDA